MKKKKRDYEFENLVFEGGGMRCIAYIGAIKVLEQKKIIEKIQRVGGTSGGAIVASLLAVGFSYKEMYSNLINVKFDEVKENPFFLFNIFHFYRRFGWYKGEVFEKWFKSLLAKKVERDITLGELHKLKSSRKEIKDLFIVGAEINNQRDVILSYENYPDMPVSTAVRISMSIPFVFSAVRYKKQLFVDGGLYFNYPITMFDKKQYISNKNFKSNEIAPYNDKTLGFRIDSKREIMIELGEEHVPPPKINSLSQFFITFLESIYAMQNVHYHENDIPRTVFIDSKNIGWLQFNLSLAQKKALIKSGENAANAYFEWFDNPTSERRIA